MKNISYFNPPISNIIPTKTVSITEIIEEIRGPRLKDITERLRALPKNQQSEFKKINLPGVTFSARVQKRADNHLISHTGLICVDIDLKNKFDVMRKSFLVPRHGEPPTPVVMCLISPSKMGLKVVLKVDHADHTQKENYEAAIKFIKEKTGLRDEYFDTSCSNVSRLCFLCHDENVWVNEKLKDNDMSEIPTLDTGNILKNSSEASLMSDVTLHDESDKISMTWPIDVSKTRDQYLNVSHLDFNHKAERANFIKLLQITLSKNGIYAKGKRHTFLQRLTAYANQFGMPKEYFLKYSKEYFCRHEQTLCKEDPLSLDKELVPLICDVYKRYESQFDSWNEEEVRDELETPLLPDDLYKSLPHFLRDACLKFENPRERDVYLLGALAVLSTCFPRIQGQYDNQFLGANLFVMISAPASAGKGKLHWARKLGSAIAKSLNQQYESELVEYDEQMREYEKAKNTEEKQSKPIKPIKKKFFIPGNFSSSSIIAQLANNKCFGIIFETEADTLTNTLASEWGNFSDIVRRVFHHEAVCMQRRTNSEDIEVEKPYLSLLLSGTPHQVEKLMGSLENGFFSRFLFYDFPQNFKWRDVFRKTEESFETTFRILSERLESYSSPYFQPVEEDLSNLIIFSFTSQQEERFNNWFKEKIEQLQQVYNDDIIASVKRLAVCFFRIAMILSAIRVGENKNEGFDGKKLVCNEEDYKNAELIISTLLFHMVKVFMQVKKRRRYKLGVNVKQLYYERLPEEFDRTAAMEAAYMLGIKPKTAENYLSEYIKNGLLFKPKHNQYKKTS
jgi:hypothetical protein